MTPFLLAILKTCQAFRLRVCQCRVGQRAAAAARGVLHPRAKPSRRLPRCRVSRTVYDLHPERRDDESSEEYTENLSAQQSASSGGREPCNLMALSYHRAYPRYIPELSYA